MKNVELGIISSAWVDTPVDVARGIELSAEIGFDTYDIFQDPLDMTPEEQRQILTDCERVGLPIRSVTCVAFGLLDFQPSVRRFHMERCRRYLDQCELYAARNLLLVLGEYYWNGEVIPPEQIWDFAVEGVRELGLEAAAKGVEIVIELEPFVPSMVGTIDELLRFVREVDVPAVKANADISHLDLSGATPADVARFGDLIGHVHLSDCDGKVHGDLPPGRGVTPIAEYLEAIATVGFPGTVSIELEYPPDPDRVIEWVTEAYESTAEIMDRIGIRTKR